MQIYEVEVKRQKLHKRKGLGEQMSKVFSLYLCLRL